MGIPTQGQLFGSPAVAKFLEFHAANPGVYLELRDLALDLKDRGRKFYGIMALLNVVRWQRAIRTTTADDDYKVNNNWAPFYARLLMSENPELDGFFQLRRAEADVEYE
jgi:hypothetical protein